MMHHVCHTHFPHHHSSAKSWQIILNVTGIPISISTSNGKNPLGKCSQPAVLHMYITLCWSSRFWPLKARRKPQFLIAYDVDFWSRLVPWRVHPTRTWSMKDLGNPRITHESTWDSNDETSEILSNCCFVYLNAEKCLLRRRRSRELDEDLEGKRSFLPLVCFYLSLGQEMSSTGPKAQNMTSDARHGPIGSFYHFPCFLFWRYCAVQSAWILSLICAVASLCAEADSMLMIWKFWPHDLLFSIIFQAFCPFDSACLKAQEAPNELELCFFWTQGPHVTFGPFPSLHSPMHVEKGVANNRRSAISNLPSSSSCPKYLLLSGFLSLWGHRNSNFLAQDVCLAFLRIQ